MSFVSALAALYPGAVPMDEFVARSADALGAAGFGPGNTLAMVGVCRDELMFALEQLLHDRWGSAFDLSGLAGMAFLGRTGWAAARNHAPSTDGRSRFVVFAFPHIAIDGEGRTGIIGRPGHRDGSVACGALVKLLGDLEAGSASAGLDPGDVEQSLLTTEVLARLGPESVPTLVELTELVRLIVVDELTRLSRTTADLGPTDLAFLSGVVVHGPDRDWVAPSQCWMAVGEQRTALAL